MSPRAHHSFTELKFFFCLTNSPELKKLEPAKDQLFKKLAFFGLVHLTN